MHWLDLTCLIIYFALTTGVGAWFFQKATNSEQFMTAGRSLPGWAVGLSIFGSYVSSISFLANPGKAYASNWAAAGFAFTMPLVAWLAGKYWVPFYRSQSGISAYEHLEHKFGLWARQYAVICFLLMQTMRLGTILYLLALALQPFIGWNLPVIILVLAVLTVVFPLLGGTEGVIWAGVLQAIILLVGPIVCLAVLFIGMPGGMSGFWSRTWDARKFDLATHWSKNWYEALFRQSLNPDAPWFDRLIDQIPQMNALPLMAVLIYGLFTHLQNFGIDQGYVQRYLTARTDAEARRSLWLGAAMFIPVSLLFFLIGTALYAFYLPQLELLPKEIQPDQVFPHFLSTEMPPGLRGLVLAALCAAAMDSNLNSLASLWLCDIHLRLFQKDCSEKTREWILRVSVIIFAALSASAAIWMIDAKSALDVWWNVAGLCSGGVLGLFLLGRGRYPVPGTIAAAALFCGVASMVMLNVPKWYGIGLDFIDPLYSMPLGTMVTLVTGVVTSRISRWTAGVTG